MIIELYKKRNPFLYNSWYISKVKSVTEKICILDIKEYGEALENKTIILVSRLNAYGNMITRIAYNIDGGRLFFFYTKANRITTRVITEEIDIILYPWREQFAIPIRKNNRIVQTLWILERTIVP